MVYIKNPIKHEVKIVKAKNETFNKKMNELCEQNEGTIDLKEFVKHFQQNEAETKKLLKENEARLVADYPTNKSVIRRLLQTKEQ